MRKKLKISVIVRFTQRMWRERDLIYRHYNNDFNNSFDNCHCLKSMKKCLKRSFKEVSKFFKTLEILISLKVVHPRKLELRQK